MSEKKTDDERDNDELSDESLDGVSGGTAQMETVTQKAVTTQTTQTTTPTVGSFGQFGQFGQKTGG